MADIVGEARELMDDPAFLEHGYTVTLKPGGDQTITPRQEPGAKRCGGCTLCCKLLPVPEIHKEASVRCRHQSFAKGCKIYRKAGFPNSCRLWNCRWLADPDMASMPRPDRAHYVVDMEIDTIKLLPHDGSEAKRIPVVQVWVDPAFPDVIHSPDLRNYMAMVGEKYRCMTLLRFNSEKAIAVCPPSMAASGEFEYQDSGITMERRDFVRELANDTLPPLPISSASNRSDRDEGQVAPKAEQERVEGGDRGDAEGPAQAETR